MHSTRTTHDTRTGDERESRLFAPCRAACPVHIDVPGYLTAVAEGRFTDALEIVLERNPLPSVCGRVCLRPCEEGCRRCLLDDPVAVAHIKRAAADFGSYPTQQKARPRPETVAVVGSGPAGLTASADLAELGFQVTIYEQKPELGGMLRYGIPDYRLPDYALDRDIDYILSRGVEAVTDARVGADITLDELADANDAVLVTAGLQASRSLPIEGADLPEAIMALPFLEACARGEDVEVGKRVVVVGGGNVAMDVARAARRQGAEQVHVVCLEDEEEMPASDFEVEEARQEGVHVHCSWGPAQVVGDGTVCGLEAVRCTSVFDHEKRFAPKFDESVVQEFEADTVIFAIGQAPDIGDLGLECTERGVPEVDPTTLRTGTDKVYAAGDVVSGPTMIIDAIAAGHRAAASIARDLTGDGRMLADLDEENAVLGEVPETMSSKLETRRRLQMERLEIWEAVGSFDEVELGYTEYEAAREAQRCLGCTTGARLVKEKCAACLTGMRVCPHGAPHIKVGGYVYFDAEACNACGACASECPAQAIAIEGYSEEEMSRRIERQLVHHGMGTTLVFACGSAPVLPEIPGDDVRLLTTTCHLRVSERAVLEALREGASHVVFAGCVEATCRFPYARPIVTKRMKQIQATLAEIGMEDSFVVIGGADEEELAHL